MASAVNHRWTSNNRLHPHPFPPTPPRSSRFPSPRPTPFPSPTTPHSSPLQIVLFNEPPSPMAAAGALIVVAANAALATARLHDAEAAVRECQKAELV